jgi:murein DD-endopeptidase MepM/ murein hydrolase activator NlpD
MVEALSEAPERPRLELTARLGGSSFEGALRRAGVGAEEAALVTRLASAEAKLGALPGSTSFDIVLGRRETRAVPRPLESLGFRAAFDLRLIVQRGEDGNLQLKRVPIAVDDTPLRLSGTVGKNMARAVRAAGVPDAIAGEFVKQLSYAVDFQHGVSAKDRWELVVEHKRAETGETQTGNLLYAALDRKGQDKVELGRFDYGGHPQFFRANGESARKGLMRTPVDGARLTSGFGMRFHPILNYSRMHQGVDFGAEWGSPVVAAATGKVSFAGPHGGHGNYIMVQHNKDLATAYAHLSRFAVKPGQSVTQGQVIGYVGSTGLSTGPHLHYEVWLRGQATNPQTIKFLGGTQLAGAELSKFQAQLARYRKLAGVSVADSEDDKPAKRRRA